MLRADASEGDRRQRDVVEHHDDAEERRREAHRRRVAEVARQQRGHPVVGLDATHEVTREALAEELDRQPQHVPGELRRLLEREPQLHAQQRQPLQRHSRS